MKIGKAELRTFIDGRIETNIQKVQKDIEDMLQRLAEEYVYKNGDVVGLVALGNEAKDIAQKIEHVRDEYNLESNDSIVSALSNINYYITNIHGSVVNTIKQRISKVAKNDSYYNREFGIDKAKESSLYTDELILVCRIAIEGVKNFDKKIDDLNLLKKELNDVISVEATGNRAYKKLESLGVDMSGFEPEVKELPAIQGLSVSASLFKKG